MPQKREKRNFAKKYLVVDIDLAAVHAVLGPAYWRKNLPPSQLYRASTWKNVSRVMTSCPSQRTEISVCACSA